MRAECVRGLGAVASAGGDGVATWVWILDGDVVECGGCFGQERNACCLLAIKAWSAISEGLARPWPPCLRGRGMHPRARAASSAAFSLAEIPVMCPNVLMNPCNSRRRLGERSAKVRT